MTMLIGTPEMRYGAVAWRGVAIRRGHSVVVNLPIRHRAMLDLPHGVIAVENAD